jgi:hypothetical protein
MSSSDEILVMLTDNGYLGLDPDPHLTGYSLEIRIKRIFISLGFNITRGRVGFEDFIVHPFDGAIPKEPLVLEVKSSRRPKISRDDLRQLDDWVFDLSGEERARKQGLGGGIDIDPLALVTKGMVSSPKRHPSPHKGVLIFNGPVGVPFGDRPSSCINENDIDFIEKRNLCIIPINILPTYFDEFQIIPQVFNALWVFIHFTIGQLPTIGKLPKLKIRNGRLIEIEEPAEPDVE